MEQRQQARQQRLLGSAQRAWSRSAKGCCWHNAVVESFLSALTRKLNLDHDRAVLISPQQLQRDLAFCARGAPRPAGAIAARGRRQHEDVEKSQRACLVLAIGKSLESGEGMVAAEDLLQQRKHKRGAGVGTVVMPIVSFGRVRIIADSLDHKWNNGVSMRTAH